MRRYFPGMTRAPEGATRPASFASTASFLRGAVFGGCLVIAGYGAFEKSPWVPLPQVAGDQISTLIAALPAERQARLASAISVFSEASALVEQQHISRQLDSETISRMVDGALGQLDPWSGYMGSDLAQSLISDEDRDHRLQIGFLVSAADGQYRVEAMTPGGPAELAGIMPGDQVVRVGGRDVSAETPYTINQILIEEMAALQGDPISLGLRRSGADSIVSVVVRPADIPPVSVFDLGVKEGVLHLYLQKFYPGMAADADRLIARAIRMHGIRGVVLDLRNNGGGLTEEATALASLFLPENSLLYEISGRTIGVERVTTTEMPKYADLRVALIVNGKSASASEIIAGAFQALDRGAVVGWPTLGKGTVQRIFPIAEGAITITFAEYRDAGLRKIDGIGVMPDIRMDAPDPRVRPSRFDRDSARRAAMEAARDAR